jgi:hypothetical protein
MRIVCGEEINLQVSRKATDFMDINIQISIYENVSYLSDTSNKKRLQLTLKCKIILITELP